jgi:hypothetical protein
MKKNLYSLILAEEVVDAIDRIAVQNKTNRSHLINEILAEYVSLTTPEKRISGVFREIDRLLSGVGADVSYDEHDDVIVLKSALAVKYRPAVKYEVQLFHTFGDCFGQLRVNVRTQSLSLSSILSHFFAMWQKLEKAYLGTYYNERIEYTGEGTRWTRLLTLPAPDCDLSKAITDYVGVLDKLLKNYLSNGSAQELESAYVSALNQGLLRI